MELMFYESVFRALAERKVRYVVVGGVALVLHGVVRFTADLDLAVSLDRANLSSFLGAMSDLGFKPRAPVAASALLDAAVREQWKREKGMKVFTFYHPSQLMQQIDMFVDEPVPFEELSRDMQIFEISGVPVPVVSREHLKQLKTMSGREQDLVDLAALTDLERFDE